MSNVREFEDLLRSDESMQAELSAAMKAYEGDRTDDKAIFDAVVVPLAEARGLPVTYDEVAEYASSGKELSEEELDKVAGGESYCFIIGGSTEPDAYACSGPEKCGAVACGYIGVGFFDDFLPEWI